MSNLESQPCSWLGNCPLTMTPEPPVVLPLTEGLEKLCSPNLVADLGSVAKKMRDLVEQFASREAASERDPKMATAVTDSVQRQLISANAALRADLVERIGRGELHLCGRLTNGAESDPSTSIPAEALRGATIDLLASTVRGPGGCYTEVRVVLGPAPVPGGAEPRLLPLAEAVSLWCDPWIVVQIRQQERFFPTHRIHGRGYPEISLPAGAKVSTSSYLLEDRGVELRRSLDGYWRDLARDLKSRIERGEVHLTGVQTRPERRTERESIPSLWAADFHFGFLEGAVTVTPFRYIAVLCSLDPPPEQATTAGAAAPVPADPAVGGPADLKEGGHETIGLPPRADGRPPFVAMIEADLRENWEQVQRRAAQKPGKRPVWTEEAKAMHRRLEAKHAKGRTRIPQKGTIRKHLPDIYDRLVEETAGR